MRATATRIACEIESFERGYALYRLFPVVNIGMKNDLLNIAGTVHAPLIKIVVSISTNWYIGIAALAGSIRRKARLHCAIADLNRQIS